MKFIYLLIKLLRYDLIYILKIKIGKGTCENFIKNQNILTDLLTHSFVHQNKRNG
jgi:hypothetical protein